MRQGAHHAVVVDLASGWDDSHQSTALPADPAGRFELMMDVLASWATAANQRTSALAPGPVQHGIAQRVVTARLHPADLTAVVLDVSGKIQVGEHRRAQCELEPPLTVPEAVAVQLELPAVTVVRQQIQLAVKRLRKLHSRSDLAATNVRRRHRGETGHPAEQPRG